MSSQNFIYLNVFSRIFYIEPNAWSMQQIVIINCARDLQKITQQLKKKLIVLY